MTISFENQVAVVTGAGGGLGKTYAKMLASMGAKVVVNDYGGSLKGETGGVKNQINPADKVVNEIKANGGTAVANYDSVENGQTIIDTAIKNFGKLDILVNNAGILRDVSFGKMTEKDFNMVMEVHLKGTFNCCKAAWPHMVKQRYGRIVNTSSASGIFGNFGQVNYSSAKSALLGFSKSLAHEGAPKNIFVNCIAPIAGTRMTQTVMQQEMIDALKPEYVAPFVCYLSSKECEENGGVFEVGAGWAAKLRHQRSAGKFFPVNFTTNDVAKHWNEVTNFSNIEKNTYPDALNDSLILVLNEVLSKKGNQPTNNTMSYKIFKMFEAYMKSNPEETRKIVHKVGCVYEFQIKKNRVNPPAFFYTMDLKNGAITYDQSKTPDAIFTMTDDIFCDICTGKTNAQKSVQNGTVKVKGSISAMMKYNKDIFPPITDNMLAQELSKAVENYANGGSFTSSGPGNNDPMINMRKTLKETGLKSANMIEQIFDQMSTPMGQKKVEKVKFVYQLDLMKTKDSKPVSFTLDLKSSPVKGFMGSAEKFDAKFSMTDDDFMNIMTGKLNPQTAFIQGKMKIKGNMGAAMKFTPDLFLTQSKL
uniref:Hydroxysteroid 17-beta dehydrogenase 4 n=1 Tax=Nephromyces sp. MMRI TaxID=2496275 RepID=A0A3S8V2Y1_9APIC|nr:hydroxysteroid 17-beta dehydrogenase 4 [Nephromyces sp. MMRI]